MITFACTECGKRLEVKAEYAGKDVRCPGCGAIVTVPQHSSNSERAGEQIHGDRASLDDLAAAVRQTTSHPPERPYSGRRTSSRPQSRKPRPPSTARSDRKPYAIASLLLAASTIVLYFVPWYDFMVVKVSPVSFVANVGHFVPSRSNADERPRPLARGPARKNIDTKALRRGLCGFMLVTSPFLYTLGLLAVTIGALVILNRWRSGIATLGFLLCSAACLMTLLGWHFLFMSKGEGALAGLVGTAGFGLTTFFYGACFSSGLGLVTSFITLSK